LAALKAASQGVDVQSSVDKAFMMGTINVLFDIEFKPSITDTMVAGVKGFIGAHDASDGLQAPAFYMGGGKFTVTMAVGTGFGGKAQGGAGAFGPGELTVQFPLVQAQPPLDAHLIAATLSGTMSMMSITNGKLCGAIPADELKTSILPKVADLLSAQVKKGGSTADTIVNLFDTDHSCMADAACQMTAPAQPACHCITESEVENNTLIKSLLSPDLDLDPNKNNPFITDTNDPMYKNDALSLGLGFEANSAMFPAQ